MELKKGLSIIMPCLNEEKTLPICIEKAKNFLGRWNIDGEIIIADNGSEDNSVQIALDMGVRVVFVKERGYGAALRGGIREASFNYIIMGDADDSYDFSSLDNFIEKLDDGYELVMGNRFQGGIEPGAMPFSHQYIGNPLLSGIGRIFFKTKIGDFHCGLRAFRKESIEKLGLCTTGMEFASEMCVKAVLYGLRIAEVPCKLYPDGRNRAPHLRSIPDGFRHLEFLLMYSPRWLFSYPGILLTIIGTFFMVFIYIRPLVLGRVQFEVTSMFYSSIIALIGLHMLSFAVYTEILGRRFGQFPEKVGLTKWIMEVINRGWGYLLALALILCGLGGCIWTLYLWGQTGFGQLSDTKICKMAILFGTFLATGIEMLLFTLFVRILQMGGHNEK